MLSLKSRKIYPSPRHYSDTPKIVQKFNFGANLAKPISRKSFSSNFFDGVIKMKKQLWIIVALFSLVFTSQAFGQSSIGDAAEDVSTQALMFDDVSSLLGTAPSLSAVVVQGGSSSSGSYRHTRQSVRRTTYRTNYRPRYYAPAPVVVVPSAHVAESTTVAVDGSASAQSSSFVKMSFGLRVLGLSERKTNVDGICFEDPMFGGVGLYFRVRPLRYIGVEIASDILFTSEQDVSTFKVPLTVGLMGHIFDYSFYDVYAIAAGGVIFNTINYNTYGSRDEKYIQFTGQFGAGVGLTFSGIELFLDARYTVTQARPGLDFNNSYYEHSANSASDDKVTHGILFMLGMGFSN